MFIVACILTHTHTLPHERKEAEKTQQICDNRIHINSCVFVFIYCYTFTQRPRSASAGSKCWQSHCIQYMYRAVVDDCFFSLVLHFFTESTFFDETNIPDIEFGVGGKWWRWWWHFLLLFFRDWLLFGKYLLQYKMRSHLFKHQMSNGIA